MGVAHNGKTKTKLPIRRTTLLYGKLELVPKVSVLERVLCTDTLRDNNSNARYHDGEDSTVISVCLPGNVL